MFHVQCLRLALFCACCVFGIAAVSSHAHAQPEPPSRIVERLDTGKLKHLPRSTHPRATPDRDQGRADPALPLRRMILVLSRSAQQNAQLDELIASQQQAGSPGFHLGLTPEQFASEFGPSDADLEQIESWLGVQGFTIDAVARGRQWIEFSGSAGQVESAFHTQMHEFSVDGRTHVANATDISIPQALAPVVAGVLSLNDFRKPSMRSKTQRVSRMADGSFAPTGQFTTGGGSHHLAPGDLARLYDIAPLHAGGTTGSGVAIAIAGRTSIQLSDVQTFRSVFGLPANDPVIINNGDAPQRLDGDEVESDLDLEWASATAPDAAIKFVTSASSIVTDGIDLSNSYIVDNKVAPIMSLSYGLCEAFLGDAGNAFYAALFQQAAVEGITVFVSSGDNGAAGCDPPESFGPAQNGLAVNGLASTPYNIAVGGTQFDEGGNDANYWTAANNPDMSSVLGYIPERVWNETCDPAKTPESCSNYELWSGSGGASGVYAKPSWQAAIGVPKDGARDLPDLSLTAAGSHDGYLVCAQDSCKTDPDTGALSSAYVVGGTSASAPAMAGIMALIEQKNGTWLGLANDDFYALAANDVLAQCNSTHQTDPTQPTACVFHDVTDGDNSVPGLTGFRAARGYDRASGLGSVDAANIANAWSINPPRATVTTLASAAPTITHGQPFPLTVSVVPASGSGTPSGFFALETPQFGAFVGGALSNGVFDGSVDNLPGGTYELTAHYAGDLVFAGSDSNPVAINIVPEDSTLSIGCITLNFANFVVDCFGFENYGQPTALTFAVSGLSGKGAPGGTIDVMLDGAPLATVTVQNGKAGLQVDGLPASTGLLPGLHTFTATYNGDNSFNASAAQPYPTEIDPTSPFSSVTTIDNSGVVEVAAMTPLPLVLQVHGPGVLEPVGKVQLFDRVSGETFGPELTLDAFGVATETVTFTVPGTYDLCVNYGGDDNYYSIECNFSHGNVAELSVTVDPAPDPVFADGFEIP